MSHKYPLFMQMSASPHVTCRPVCAIRQFNATVLMETVFPPVFGPVMMTPLMPFPISNCNGTQIFCSISGCRASFKTIRRCVLICSSRASISTLSFPFEKIKSSFSITLIFSFMIPAQSATIAVSVYKIRYTSFSSSIFKSCSSSYRLETLTGSTNIVFPVEDLSMALPGIFHLYSFFTGTHSLPFRKVEN